MPTSAHTASDKLETAQRRAFVLQLRKAGVTYPNIARAAIEKFGVDRLPRGWDERYAYKDVKRELDKIRVEISESASNVLALELQRLDALLKALWAEAARKNPDHSAVDRVLKIMERRAKLLGLDAPSKQQITDADGGPLTFVIAGADPDKL